MGRVGGRPPSLASLDSLSLACRSCRHAKCASTTTTTTADKNSNSDPSKNSKNSMRRVLLSSLLSAPRQSIRLVELVRRELGFVATSAMVLRSADVHALAEAIQLEGSQDSRQDAGQDRDRDIGHATPVGVSVSFFLRCLLEGGRHATRRRGRLQIVHHGVWEVPRGLVPSSVWSAEAKPPATLSADSRCVRYGGPGHLDVDALQRASDRAVARHSALRTMELRDEGMREAMDRAAAMWQRLVRDRMRERRHGFWGFLGFSRFLVGLMSFQQIFTSLRLLCSAHGTTSWRWSAARRAMRALLFAAWPRTFLKSACDAVVQAAAGALFPLLCMSHPFQLSLSLFFSLFLSLSLSLSRISVFLSVPLSPSLPLSLAPLALYEPGCWVLGNRSSLRCPKRTLRERESEFLARRDGTLFTLPTVSFNQLQTYQSATSRRACPLFL